MILNKAVIEELKAVKVEDEDIEVEIADILKKHKIEFTEVYQNEMSPEFIRVYNNNKQIIQITLDFIIEEETDYIIVKDIDEL